ncbi:hypothetical protein HA402_002325 [Bradysia odoriphaga]|nr:hypothetical protein HA402_002325 [Bradysia odoriphaga]
MSDEAAKPVGRPMKFPYTFSAKIAQFPYKFYFQNQWIWKFYAVGVLVSIPVFYKISQLANSPGNVAKWAEAKRKEAESHH